MNATRVLLLRSVNWWSVSHHFRHFALQIPSHSPENDLSYIHPQNIKYTVAVGLFLSGGQHPPMGCITAHAPACPGLFSPQTNLFLSWAHDHKLYTVVMQGLYSNLILLLFNNAITQAHCRFSTSLACQGEPLHHRRDESLNTWRPSPQGCHKEPQGDRQFRLDHTHLKDE